MTRALRAAEPPPPISQPVPSGHLDKQAYLRLRAVLRFQPSLFPTLAIVAMDAGVLWVVVKLLQMPGFLPYLFSQLLLALVYFNMFAVLHECGHGNASKSRLVNVVLGHIASVFCAIPFYPWQFIHNKHHAFTGCIDRDPVLASLRGWRRHGVPPLVEFGWRSWIPLAALAQHIVYLKYPYVMWREGERIRSKLIRCGVSMVWLIGCYATLAAAFGEIVRFQNLWLSVLLFLIVEELVNLPHHTDVSTFDEKLPVWEQYRATRSCYYPPGCSELMVLNFNFHTEHHLFPTLPWFRLRRARRLLREELGDAYREAVGVQWNLENRQRDLGSMVETGRDVDIELPQSGLQGLASGWRFRNVSKREESG